MLAFLTLLLEGLALAVAIVTVFFIHRLRHPPRRTYASAMARGLPGDPGELDTPRAFEAWTFRGDAFRSPRWRGLDLPVWDIAGDDPDGPVAIVTPGWGDSKIGVLPRLPALAPACSRIVVWDPPGHGEARGKCMLGTREAEAILALIERAAADGRVVLYGWSLGAGASMVAAAHTAGADGASAARIAGVIAEAPYRLPWTPASRVMRNAGHPFAIPGPIGFALLGMRLGVGPRWRGFDRVRFAEGIPCPLLIVHGSDDEVCPIDDGRAIARAAAKGEMFEVTGAGHNDLWTDERFAGPCARVCIEFIRRVTRAESRKE